MSSNLKLIAGIVIGVVIGLGIWAVSNSKNPPQPVPLENASPSPTPTVFLTPTPLSTNTNSTQQTGQQTVTGRFSIYAIGLVPDTVFFTTDTDTTTSGLPKNSYFAFKNQAEARSALQVDKAGRLGLPACDYIAGKAEVTISGYSIPAEPGDAPNTATLVKVNKIVQPAACGRGTP